MLNPLSRLAFALGALALLLCFRIWLKLSNAEDKDVPRLIRRLAFPMSAATLLFAVGIAAMAIFGPWARPYSKSSILEEIQMPPSDDNS